jgi:hypothetical protein
VTRFFNRDIVSGVANVIANSRGAAWSPTFNRDSIYYAVFGRNSYDYPDSIQRVIEASESADEMRAAAGRAMLRILGDYATAATDPIVNEYDDRQVRAYLDLGDLDPSNASNLEVIDSVRILLDNSASAPTNYFMASAYDAEVFTIQKVRAVLREKFPHLLFDFRGETSDRRYRRITPRLNPDFFTPLEIRFGSELNLNRRYATQLSSDHIALSVESDGTINTNPVLPEGGLFVATGISITSWRLENLKAEIVEARETYRNTILSKMRREASVEQAKRDEERLNKRRKAERTFENRRRTVPMTTEVHIPTLAFVPQGQGIKSSRRWGIEIETGAGRDITSIPDQWESKGDGSLESAYGERYETRDIPEEECDRAYYHRLPEDHRYYANPAFCSYHGEDIQVYVDDYNDDDCVEVVSPILSSMHSRGLQSLCNDLEHAPRTESAGIHVHVEAKDLTMRQVRELLLSYDHIEPLIEASYDRTERGYCKRRSTGELLTIVRQIKDNPTHTIRQIERGDRYVTVNLWSLTAHGTIEFRAMGPIYNYDHLTRWAMFCREMVNTVAAGATAKEWGRVKDWAGVEKMFRKYGVELNWAEGHKSPADASTEHELAAV